MFRFLILLLALAYAVPAQASGTWYTRYGVSTGFRSCSGKLVEKFVTETAVTDEGRDYMLICLTGRNTAEWIFRAGFHCDATLGNDAKNDPFHVSHIWCNDELYKSLADGQIAITSQQAFKNTSVDWQFTRYGIGSDCNYYTSLNGMPDLHWKCADVKVRFDQDLRFTTKSSLLLTIDDSDTANMWFGRFAESPDPTCRVGRRGPKLSPKADCSGLNITY